MATIEEMIEEMCDEVEMADSRNKMRAELKGRAITTMARDLLIGDAEKLFGAFDDNEELARIRIQQSLALAELIYDEAAKWARKQKQ